MMEGRQQETVVVLLRSWVTCRSPFPSASQERQLLRGEQELDGWCVGAWATEGLIPGNSLRSFNSWRPSLLVVPMCSSPPWPSWRRRFCGAFLRPYPAILWIHREEYLYSFGKAK